MHSKSALLLSIRRITQVNKGKKTAGVDGFTVLTDGERMKLYLKVANYQISCHRPKPSHRTYIKKKNGKLRPLSIPTIKDRIYQNIAKIALEPQWGVRFDLADKVARSVLRGGSPGNGADLPDVRYTLYRLEVKQ